MVQPHRSGGLSLWLLSNPGGRQTDERRAEFASPNQTNHHNGRSLTGPSDRRIVLPAEFDLHNRDHQEEVIPCH